MKPDLCRFQRRSLLLNKEGERERSFQEQEEQQEEEEDQEEDQGKRPQHVVSLFGPSMGGEQRLKRGLQKKKKSSCAAQGVSNEVVLLCSSTNCTNCLFLPLCVQS